MNGWKRNAGHLGYRECDCKCNRVQSFFIANHSFDDSYFGKQEVSEKDKVYRSGQRIFIRQASIGAPDAAMSQKRRSKHRASQSISSPFDVQAVSAFSALIFQNGVDKQGSK